MTVQGFQVQPLTFEILCLSLGWRFTCGKQSNWHPSLCSALHWRINQGEICTKHTTFLIMQQGCKDPLLKLKLLFFVSVAKQFEAFLVRYQTDKPMIPHLCGDLLKLIKALMARFIKESGLKSSSTPQALVAVHLDKSSVSWELVWHWLCSWYRGEKTSCQRDDSGG